MFLQALFVYCHIVHSKLASLSQIHNYKPTPKIPGIQLPSAETHTEPDTDNWKKCNLLHASIPEFPIEGSAKVWIEKGHLVPCEAPI